MQYNVYCLLKDENLGKSDRVIRVNVFADCINEALQKAKDKFKQKIEESKFKIFMYETIK